LASAILEALVLLGLAAWLMRSQSPEPSPSQCTDTQPPRLSGWRSARWYTWCGGILSAYTLTIGISVAADVGVALTTLTMTAGKLATSVLVDHFGLAGERKPVRASQIVGLLVIGVGMAMAVAANAETNIAQLGPIRAALYLVLLLVVGVCVPFISVLNGQLRSVLGHTLKAASVSDFVTFLVLLVIAASLLASGGRLNVEDLQGVPFWAWLGGPLCACFTCIVIVVPSVIGMAAFACIFTAGTQFWAIVVDRLGIFAAQREASALTVIGVTVVVLCAALVTTEIKAGGAQGRKRLDNLLDVTSIESGNGEN